MLVKLYSREYTSSREKLLANGITVKRAYIGDKHIILDFVKNFSNNNPYWVNETEYALFNDPSSCFVAVKDKEIIGFACYNATAKGFFGPLGVNKAFRNQGVGKELLMRCLYSMKESGYAYAIIGWIDGNAVDFYKRTVSAVIIDDSPPNKSIYKNSVSQE